MKDAINAGRRRFLGAAGMTIAAAGFGAVDAGAAQPGQARSFGAPKQIDAGVLNVGYAEVGPTAGRPAVPTITLEGDANGAPHPDPGSYAKKFSGKYEHAF